VLLEEPLHLVAALVFFVLLHRKRTSKY
jgi:hypothetical protein